ncbi:extensin-like domain-containing protein [Rhodoblastus sp.]|uniref:extensin-like domain-containing protein n=1 Tax=Rhodoblastus sp. TaxID=1962975 RepID=UPI003F985651
MASGRIVAALIAPVVGPDHCGIAAPLKLSAIILPDGARVPLEPESLLRCDFAEALADWVREDVAPLARIAGGGLAKILGSDGYECRSRNRISGAIISEHATGNALDLRGFKLQDGRTLLIGSANEDLDFMTQIRDTSCARFTTVLGPGSDGYHQMHLHFDLKARRIGYRICQWDME